MPANVTNIADVTVLMAVYDRVDPNHLRAGLQSLAVQTTPAKEVIVIADGALPTGLTDVIESFDGVLPLHLIRLPSRSGAGPARNAGLKVATCTWIAIADADDVSRPTRLETQLRAAVDRELDLIGAAVEEVEADGGSTLGVRAFAESHNDVVSLMRSRNAINHPTALFRRTVALSVGGYRDMPYLEDYDLMVRMIASGATVGNVGDDLVVFRGGLAAQMRRRTPEALRGEWRMQLELRSAGLIGWGRVPINWIVRTTYRLLPPRAIARVYARYFLGSCGAGSHAGGERPGYDAFRDMSVERGPHAEALARQVVLTAGPWIKVPVSEADVLDVGSGYGHTAIELARRCRSVVALEPSECLHKSAVALAGAEGVANLDLVRGEIEFLHDVEFYDLVVLDNVFEHLADQAGALNAIVRAMKPSACLYIVVPNKLWPIEAHYGLPFLSWLPIRLGNAYLRLSGRGTDYTDASYAPTYWGLKRSLGAHRNLSFRFVLPGDPTATLAGSPLHYRVGMRLLGRFPALWAISKALVVVAVKEPTDDA